MIYINGLDPYTNSRKWDNTFVNYQPNPVRVIKTKNGYAIFSFDISVDLNMLIL